MASNAWLIDTHYANWRQYAVNVFNLLTQTNLLKNIFHQVGTLHINLTLRLN